MIDTVLWLAPIVFVGAAAYPAFRHDAMSDRWRPPSSILTWWGFVATVLLLFRRIALGSWWGIVWSLFAAGCMAYAYRVAARAEASFREYRRRTEGRDG